MDSGATTNIYYTSNNHDLWKYFSFSFFLFVRFAQMPFFKYTISFPLLSYFILILCIHLIMIPQSIHYGVCNHRKVKTRFTFLFFFCFSFKAYFWFICFFLFFLVFLIIIIVTHTLLSHLLSTVSLFLVIIIIGIFMFYVLFYIFVFLSH